MKKLSYAKLIAFLSQYAPVRTDNVVIEGKNYQKIEVTIFIKEDK